MNSRNPSSRSIDNSIDNIINNDNSSSPYAIHCSHVATTASAIAIPNSTTDTTTTTATSTITTAVDTTVAATTTIATTNTNTTNTTSTAAASTTRTIDEHLAFTIQTLDQLTTIFNFPHHLSRAAIEECGPEDVTQCYNWILDNNHDIEDHGGPVVPKLDCPHLKHHVKFRIDNDDDDNNEDDSGKLSWPDSINSNTATISKTTLTTGECQHYELGVRNAARRKNEAGRMGKLKCEEVYDDDDDDDGNNDEVRDGGNGSKGSSNGRNGNGSTCPEGENWLCLECGAIMCARYANGHAKMHYEETKAEEEATVTTTMTMTADDDTHGSTSNSQSSNELVLEDGRRCAVVEEIQRAVVGHCVAVSLADLSVWCYECNAYLQHPSLEMVTKYLERVKFANEE